ncbi:uncharacterized protein LOC112208390 [Pan troglodytes]|uniref:uncharacterized protein LOC112208390 n=1 Tax=Pan troglodytes TaxID=9598 RepID=UPI000292ADDA|nr:uncharacterized protein LOC112208390 [Pan troglodytes]
MNVTFVHQALHKHLVALHISGSQGIKVKIRSLKITETAVARLALSLVLKHCSQAVTENVPQDKHELSLDERQLGAGRVHESRWERAHAAAGTRERLGGPRGLAVEGTRAGPPRRGPCLARPGESRGRPGGGGRIAGRTPRGTPGNPDSSRKAEGRQQQSATSGAAESKPLSAGPYRLNPPRSSFLTYEVSVPRRLVPSQPRANPPIPQDTNRSGRRRFSRDCPLQGAAVPPHAGGRHRTSSLAPAGRGARELRTWQDPLLLFQTRADGCDLASREVTPGDSSGEDYRSLQLRFENCSRVWGIAVRQIPPPREVSARGVNIRRPGRRSRKIRPSCLRPVTKLQCLPKTYFLTLLESLP